MHIHLSWGAPALQTPDTHSGGYGYLCEGGPRKHIHIHHCGCRGVWGAGALEERWIRIFIGCGGLALAHAHRHGGLELEPLKFRGTHALFAQTEAHSDLVLLCAEGMVEYHRSCSASPFSTEECKRSLYKFLDAFVALHDMWRAAFPDETVHPYLPFHCRPKIHLLQHLIEESIIVFGSPSLFWCYSDEDFVGVIKTVCQMTKHPATLETRVAEKSMLMAGIASFRQAHS